MNYFFDDLLKTPRRDMWNVLVVASLDEKAN